MRCSDISFVLQTEIPGGPVENGKERKVEGSLESQVQCSELKILSA